MLLGQGQGPDERSANRDHRRRWVVAGAFLCPVA